MIRILFILILSMLIACSKDKPGPVAPAGKARATLEAPPAPTNLRFEAVTDSSARVLWNASERATDYDVYYKKAVGGRWTNEPHTGIRLYNTIYDLEPNTEYRWAVRAENTDGPSAWVFGENFTTEESEGFNISLVFLDEFPEWETKIIQEAARRWEEKLRDVPDYTVPHDMTICGLGIHLKEGQVIDDIIIGVSFTDVNSLARGTGGVHATREETGVPYAGCISLFLDRWAYEGLSSAEWTNDHAIWLKLIEEQEGLEGPSHERSTEHVAVHEFGHALGIGSSPHWSDIVIQPEEGLPYFPGLNAIEQYDALPRIIDVDRNSELGIRKWYTKAIVEQPGGSLYEGNKVPLSNDGCNCHWAETLSMEVMSTGGERIDIDVDGPISTVSLGVLEDLGYEPIYEQADPFWVDFSTESIYEEGFEDEPVSGKRVTIPRIPFCGVGH